MTFAAYTETLYAIARIYDIGRWVLWESLDDGGRWVFLLREAALWRQEMAEWTS